MKKVILKYIGVSLTSFFIGGAVAHYKSSININNINTNTTTISKQIFNMPKFDIKTENAISDKNESKPIEETKDNNIYENNKLYTKGILLDDNIVDEIQSCIDNHSYPVSFYLKTNDGAEVMYNSSMSVFGASLIKAPFAMYLYQLADQGVLNTNEKINDTTVDELIYNMIYESDNNSYLLLLDKYGSKGYNAFINNLGIKSYVIGDNKWANVNSEDSIKLLEIMESYFKSTSENAKKLKELMGIAKWNKVQELLPNYYVIHKYGLTVKGYLEISIIYDKDNNPLAYLSIYDGVNLNQSNINNFMNSLVPKLDGVILKANEKTIK